MLSRHSVSKFAKFTVAGISLAMLALSPASSAQAPGRGEPDLVDRAQPADLDYTVAKSGIPNLSSTQFAWLSDGADWKDPPTGTPGHGRIKNDPDHPFLGNVEAIRSGRQPTLRIGDYRDPVLKPWAAAFMKATNEEALAGKLDVPFAAQARTESTTWSTTFWRMIGRLTTEGMNVPQALAVGVMWLRLTLLTNP